MTASKSLRGYAGRRLIGRCGLPPTRLGASLHLTAQERYPKRPLRGHHQVWRRGGCDTCAARCRTPAIHSLQAARRQDLSSESTSRCLPAGRLRCAAVACHRATHPITLGRSPVPQRQIRACADKLRPGRLSDAKRHASHDDVRGDAGVTASSWIRKTVGVEGVLARIAANCCLIFIKGGKADRGSGRDRRRGQARGERKSEALSAGSSEGQPRRGHRHAAAHREDLGGDVGSGLRDQEPDHARHLLRRAHAAHRHEPLNGLRVKQT